MAITGLPLESCRPAALFEPVVRCRRRRLIGPAAALRWGRKAMARLASAPTPRTKGVSHGFQLGLRESNTAAQAAETATVTPIPSLALGRSRLAHPSAAPMATSAAMGGTSATA